MGRSAALVALLAFAACGGGGSRVVVLGLDGLDPQAVDLLLSEGQLPNFARLREDGAYGTLRASRPLLSPVLWTTIATGRTPLDHGIGHFVAVDGATGEQVPATSAMRRVEAVWDIASTAGRRVATVGWWATWPPEPVNGVVVSDHTCYHFLFPAGESGGSGAVSFPPEARDRLAPLVRRPADLTPAELARFVDVPAADLARDFDFADDLSHFRWALATASSYADIGLELWRSERPDLLMVYLEAPDSTSHLFGHLFRATDLAGELAAQQQRYGRAVEEMYRYADEVVGRYLAELDRGTTLIVVSDHGFALGELQDDPSKTRDLRRVSERFHREDGIVYLYGRGVRAHGRTDRADQLDVTPTVLALLGLPAGSDMPGRVLTEALSGVTAPERVASHERGRATRAVATGDAAVDPQILAHLARLGYLGQGTTAAQGDRNLAALAFAAGALQRAADIYAGQVAADPANAALHTSLAGCLGAMGRYDEALAALARGLELDPVNVEALHNRAVIHERRGDLAAAVADYRTALRYAPAYEPSRQALLRLTGSDQVRVPVGAAEARAAALAARARQAARRGAYNEAMTLLDQAQAVAPGLVVVYQYRANVAYLSGDLVAAAAALEQALALEPDNALFARNLANVRRQLAASGG